MVNMACMRIYRYILYALTLGSGRVHYWLRNMEQSSAWLMFLALRIDGRHTYSTYPGSLNITQCGIRSIANGSDRHPRGHWRTNNVKFASRGVWVLSMFGYYRRFLPLGLLLPLPEDDPLKPLPAPSIDLMSLSLRDSCAPFIRPTLGRSTLAPPLFRFLSLTPPARPPPPLLSRTMPFSDASFRRCSSRCFAEDWMPLRMAMGIFFCRRMLEAPGAREVMRRSVVCMRMRPSAKGFEWSFDEGSRRWDSVSRRWSSRSWERSVRESSGRSEALPCGTGFLASDSWVGGRED
jgi:hypothetical protein